MLAGFVAVIDMFVVLEYSEVTETLIKIDYIRDCSNCCRRH